MNGLTPLILVLAIGAALLFINGTLRAQRRKEAEEDVDVPDSGPLILTSVKDYFKPVHMAPEEVPCTVYEYFIRKASIACSTGFVVECKYKDRDKIDNEKYTQKLTDLYDDLFSKDHILPAIMSFTPLCMDMALIDTLEKCTVNPETGEWMPLDQSITTWRLNKDKIYTSEEINELTFRRMFVIILYPRVAKSVVEMNNITNAFSEFFFEEGGMPTVVFQN